MPLNLLLIGLNPIRQPYWTVQTNLLLNLISRIYLLCTMAIAK